MAGKEWTDEEHARFEAWCAEKGSEIRHTAAARGWPIEYAYLKRYPVLEAQFYEDFPGVSTLLLDSVEMAASRPGTELDLAKINQIREDDGRPPLDFIPDVEDRPDFAPPKPRQPPARDEEEELFHVWMVKEINGAYHSAAARGVQAGEALFSVPHILVGRLMRRFPGLNPAWCLQEMWFGLTIYRPERLDPERVAAMKSWSDTIKEVGDEIEGRVAAATPTSNLKQ